MCAPNRRPVAGNGFASSTHGAICHRDLSLRLVAQCVPTFMTYQEVQTYEDTQERKALERKPYV